MNCAVCNSPRKSSLQEEATRRGVWVDVGSRGTIVRVLDTPVTGQTLAPSGYVTEASAVSFRSSHVAR